MSFGCASAPGAPGTSAFAVIRWPVVAGAGGISAFLVLCLTALVWAELNPPRQKAPPVAVVFAADAVSSAENGQFVPGLDWEASGTQEELPLEDGPRLFTKAAASPALLASTSSGLVFAAGLPMSERPVVSQETVDNCHGTAVTFARSPADAARQALAENKLLFTLHLSGNFEDAGFT